MHVVIYSGIVNLAELVENWAQNTDMKYVPKLAVPDFYNI